MDDVFLSSTVQDPDAPLPSQKKRKRLQQAARNINPSSSSSSSNKKSRRGNDNSDISEDEHLGTGDIDDMNLEAAPADDGASDNEDDRETAAQKRLRLAKRYLSKVREEAANGEFWTLSCHGRPDFFAHGRFRTHVGAVDSFVDPSFTTSSHSSHPH